jgi:hypothetical protein
MSNRSEQRSDEGNHMSKQSKITVAAYLDIQIAVSDISQKDIATAIGYDKPNVITMIKQGKTKLPLNKVGPLAKVLGIDPVHLLRLAMSEYHPDTWLAINHIIGRWLVTDGEMTIIQLVREVCGDIDLSLETTEHRTAFTNVVGNIAAEQFRHSLKRKRP